MGSLYRLKPERQRLTKVKETARELDSKTEKSG